MRFKDKVVLITGASRGVGRATALGFAKEGATVVINYVSNEDAAKAVVAQIEALGSKAIAIKCDVSEENEVKHMIDEIISTFGKLDILVNNAAIILDVPIFDKTVEEWKRILEINLIGPFLCAKYSSVYLKKTKGNIVNLCSNSGYNSFAPTTADYDSSKVGVISLTKNLAKELSPGIRVNGVAPGWIDTDMNKDLPQDLIEEEMKKILIGRMARPEEIANTILFLASDDASYLTGSIISVDGGANI